MLIQTMLMQTAQARAPQRAASSEPVDQVTSSSPAEGTPTAAQIRQLFQQPDGSLRELEVWRASIPKGNNTPPALTPEGNLIIQTGAGLTVLSPKGEKLQETPLKGLSRYAVPLRNDDGRVYLSTDKGMASVLPTGGLEWHKPYGSTEVAPVKGPEGSFYHGNYQGVLRRLDAEGEVIWERHVNPEDEFTHINWGMVSLPTGEVVANEDPGIVHCFDKDGNHKWTKFKEDTSCSRLSSTPDGEILVTMGDSSLACYDREGELKWHYDAHQGRRLKPGEESGGWGNTELSSEVVTSPDGKSLFVTGSFGSVTALDRDGNPRWVRELETHTGDKGVQVGEDGTVYLCGDRGSVHALDPDSGETLWEFHTGSRQNYTNIATRGDIVYLSTAEGDVHALSRNALQHRMDAAARQEQEDRPSQIQLGPNRVVIGGAWVRTRKRESASG